MDGVKVALFGQQRDDGGGCPIFRQCTKDSSEWRALIHM